MDGDLAMAGAMRKTMVYLGLAEDDDRYDDDTYDEYDDNPSERSERSNDRSAAARPVAHGASVATLPQRSVSRVVPSPGPSGDLEQAIAAGATHLRVGSAILGQRPRLQ